MKFCLPFFSFPNALTLRSHFEVTHCLLLFLDYLQRMRALEIYHLNQGIYGNTRDDAS